MLLGSEIVILSMEEAHSIYEAITYRFTGNRMEWLEKKWPYG